MSESSAIPTREELIQQLAREPIPGCRYDEDINKHLSHTMEWLLGKAADEVILRLKAEAKNATLRQQLEQTEKALAISEQYRDAYRVGKLKLYALSDEIRNAAVEYLPSGSEGPLERFGNRAKAAHPDVANYRQQLEQARQALSGIRNLFTEPMPFYIKKLGAPITNGDQAVIDAAFIAVDDALLAAQPTQETP